MPKPRKLTLKQQKFRDLYDGNGTEAARRAGYTGSDNALAQRAVELLRNSKITDAIEARRVKVAERVQLDQAWVLKRLMRIADADLRKIVEVGPTGRIAIKASDDWSDDMAYCVSQLTETETKEGGSQSIKLEPKVKALEMLGRYLKMFTDKVEATGKDGSPLLGELSKLSVPELLKIVGTIQGALKKA